MCLATQSMLSGYNWTRPLTSQGVLAGTDPPYNIYVCRAKDKTNILVGKLAGKTNLCNLAVKNKEAYASQYEVRNSYLCVTSQNHMRLSIHTPLILSNFFIIN
jgi:hypothetical protein